MPAATVIGYRPAALVEVAAVESTGAPRTTEIVSPLTNPVMDQVSPGTLSPWAMSLLSAERVSGAWATGTLRGVAALVVKFESPE